MRAHLGGMRALLVGSLLATGGAAWSNAPDFEFCDGVLRDSDCGMIVRLPAACATAQAEVPTTVNTHYFRCEDGTRVRITLAEPQSAGMLLTGRIPMVSPGTAPDAEAQALAKLPTTTPAETRIDAPSGSWTGLLERSLAKGDLVRAAVRTRHNLGPVDTVIEYFAEPGHVLAREELEKMVRSFRWLRTADPRVGKPYNAAWAALQSGDLERAVKLYDKALARDPNHAMSWTEQGGALRQLGRLDEAQAAHQRALEILPDDAIVKGNLINVLRDKATRRGAGEPSVDEPDLALLRTLYPPVLECGAESDQMWITVGWLLTGTAANDEAIRILEEAVRRWPNHVAGRVDLGHAYLRANRLEDAIHCYCEGLRRSPGDGSDRQYVMSHLEPVLKTFPELAFDRNRPEAMCEQLATMFPETPSETSSGESVGTGAAWPPGSPMALFLEGSAALYASRPRPEQARDLFRSAIRANTDLEAGRPGRLEPRFMALAWFGIGKAEHTLGRYPQAIEAFETGLSAAPQDEPMIAEGYFGLAKALARNGKKGPALEALRTAITERGFSRERAAEDEDLATLQKEPGFAELVGKGP